MSVDDLDQHAEPSLATNPRNPRNLLAACMAWHMGGGTLIASYASLDGGRSWRSNGALPLPAVDDPLSLAYAAVVPCRRDVAHRGPSLAGYVSPLAQFRPS